MFPKGFRIGEHSLVRLVTTSANSEVYEARHLPSGEPRAVKVLHSELAQTPQQVSRFLNEAQILQEFHHPHLVRVLSSDVLPNGRPFMVLEWMPVDLQQCLIPGQALAPRTAARIAHPLSQVLAVLHQHGYVHRDLKPGNVLLASRELEEPRLKLADLGLAKRLPGATAPRSSHAVSTATSTHLGTWDYMSPEQWIDSKRAEAPTDVYALGTLLFQLLAGQLPFEEEEERHLMYRHLMDPPPLELLGERPPGPLRELVSAMMAKDTKARPTMREVSEVLAPLTH